MALSELYKPRGHAGPMLIRCEKNKRRVQRAGAAPGQAHCGIGSEQTRGVNVYSQGGTCWEDTQPCQGWGMCYVLTAGTANSCSFITNLITSLYFPRALSCDGNVSFQVCKRYVGSAHRRSGFGDTCKISKKIPNFLFSFFLLLFLFFFFLLTSSFF